MLIIKSMRLIRVHSWTYLREGDMMDRQKTWQQITTMRTEMLIFDRISLRAL